MGVQLSNSIQSYLSACKTLDTVYTRNHRTRTGAVAERSFTLFDAALESLATEEELLRTARSSLSMLRNMSETLVPINLLPPEILIQIFSLSVSNWNSCRRHYIRAPRYNFAETCTHWRQLALNTPYFWDHIDIGPYVRRGLSSKLVLERAKANPLYLHIYEEEIPGWGNPEHGAQYDSDPLLEGLKPLMHRVHSLEISSLDREGNLIECVTNLWLGLCDKNLSKLLSVYYPTFGKISFDVPEEGNTLKNTSEHGKEVLSSLQALQLRDVRFDWDSNVYRGLVDLRINLAETTGIISSLELARVLTASPMLAVLKLKSVRIGYSENLAQTIPVPLNHLRVLNLVGISPVSLGELLPLITLPRSSAELSVGIGVSNGLERELRDFLGHSSITSLYCLCQSDIFRAWSFILTPLDSLRTLILDLNTYGLKDNFPPTQDDVTPQLAARSRPLNLILENSCPSSEDLNSLVSNHGVQELWIEDPGPTEAYGVAQPTEEYWQSIRASLMQAHPDLRYTFKEQNSINKQYQDISHGYWP